MGKYFSIDNPNAESDTFYSCNIKKMNENGESEIYMPYDGLLSFDSGEWTVFKYKEIERVEGSILSSNFRISNSLTSTEHSYIGGKIKLQSRAILTKLNCDSEVSREGVISIQPNPNKEIKEPYLRMSLLDSATLNINLKLNADDFECLADHIIQSKLNAVHLELSNIEGIYESSDNSNLIILDAHQNIKKSKGSAEKPARLGEVGTVKIKEIYKPEHYKNKNEKRDADPIASKSESVEQLKQEIASLSAKYSKNTAEFHTGLKLIIVLLIISNSILAFLLRG